MRRNPKVDGLVGESLDTTTRADAVVVDADAGGGVIRVEHLGVQGIGKGCAGSRQTGDGSGLPIGAAAGHNQCDHQQCQQDRNVPLVASTK